MIIDPYRFGGAVVTPNLYTGITLGTLRNNFDGCVGSRFVINTTGLAITHLSRWKVTGNNQIHTLYLIANTSGYTVVDSVSVDMSTGVAGSWVTAALGSPVSVGNATNWIILSSEVNGGDQWYDDDSTVGSVYSGIVQDTSAGNTNTPPDGAGNFIHLSAPALYVPVNAVITP